MAVRKPSHQEDHHVPNMHRLIRWSTQASICRKFQNGQEIGSDFSCIFEIPSGMPHTKLTTCGKLGY